jgi:hypothetical protein
MPGLVSSSAGDGITIREAVLTSGQEQCAAAEDGKEQCAAEDVDIQPPAALAATGLLGPPDQKEGIARRPARQRAVPNRYADMEVDVNVEEQPEVAVEDFGSKRKRSAAAAATGSKATGSKGKKQKKNVKDVLPEDLDGLLTILVLAKKPAGSPPAVTLKPKGEQNLRKVRSPRRAPQVAV